jgi:hypothetical protein
MDECPIFRWFGVYQCQLGIAGCFGQEDEYTFWNDEYVVLLLCPGWFTESVLLVVVLTTVWVELMTDNGLFNLRKRVVSRDLRLIAASTLFLGAFVGRAILAPLGYAGTLGVAVGMRVLIAISWGFVGIKAKKASPSPAA